MGSIKISDVRLDKTPGKDLSEKIKTIIQDEIKLKNPSVKFASDIRFRAPKSSDEQFLSNYAIRLASQELAKQEEEHEYLGELINTVDKKVILFRYPQIKESWKQQREIWETWKEFIRVFIDDFDDAEIMDLEQGDILGEYRVAEESEIRKKLLRDYPEDAEKLGFQKIKKEEPQTV